MHKYEKLFVCLSGALALSMSASICDTHFSNSCNISCNDIIYFKINIYVFCCIFNKYPAIRCTLFLRFTICKVQEHIGSAPSFIFYIHHFFYSLPSYPGQLCPRSHGFSPSSAVKILDNTINSDIYPSKDIHNIIKLIHCFNQNCL